MNRGQLVDFEGHIAIVNQVGDDGTLSVPCDLPNGVTVLRPDDEPPRAA